MEVFKASDRQIIVFVFVLHLFRIVPAHLVSAHALFFGHHDVLEFQRGVTREWEGPVRVTGFAPVGENLFPVLVELVPETIQAARGLACPAPP